MKRVRMNFLQYTYHDILLLIERGIRMDMLFVYLFITVFFSVLNVVAEDKRTEPTRS